jgi:hypothetical protein
MANISIQRALIMLKTLSSRIEEEINKSTFCEIKKKNSKTINSKYNVEEFSKSAQSSRDKIFQMIEQYREIKFKIALSNAGVTQEMIPNLVTVPFMKKECTLIEIIENKSLIPLLEKLYSTISNSYSNIFNKVEQRNQTAEITADKYVIDLFGSKDATNQQVDETKATYIANNTYELVDPLNVQEILTALKEEINCYKQDCDIILSEQNAIRKIDIED